MWWWVRLRVLPGAQATPPSGNMRPCCWGPGISWDSQRCKFVRAGLFLGFAMAHMYGDRVSMTWCSRNNDGADLWGSWGSHQPIGILNDLQVSEVTQFCGDQLAPAHGQWRKLVETASHSQVVMGVCLAVHTTEHSRQPPPPTDFSLQFKDDV